MKDVTKTNFKNILVLLFTLLILFSGLMAIFIGTGAFILSIPWAVISMVLLIIICFHFKVYFNYKNNTNILVGIITNVHCYKSYHVLITSGNQNYIAVYKFISSHIRKQVGRKCTFVVNKNNKVYIKDIE